MFLANPGICDGKGAWRIAPELRKLLKYKPFVELAPGHDESWKFAAVWNSRSSKEAGSSTFAPARELEPDVTEMEAAIRTGSCIASSRPVMGIKSVYAGHKSVDAEERRRAKEYASRDILVPTSPIALGPREWIGSNNFVKLEAARVAQWP